jgi:hypothetical protein
MSSFKKINTYIHQKPKLNEPYSKQTLRSQELLCQNSEELWLKIKLLVGISSDRLCLSSYQKDSLT